jgi:IMP dehydrogenase/GMP reductase
MDLLHEVRGCTFDDFLLAPQYSIVDRRDPASLDLSSRLTPRLTLRRPIVSANMDTVTRAEMAVVMAEEGGIGIIDRGFRPGDIEPQVREVLKVKRTQHGVISDPMTIGRITPWRRPPTPCGRRVSARWWSSTATTAWRACSRSAISASSMHRSRGSPRA